ncbi:hypothetical protein KKG71_06740 [Patescibacteria group bacterium]|nr:hypothetical protein [Patescibacteria group bacterium]
MSFASKLALVKEMLESAVSNTRSAQRIINDLAGDSGSADSKKYEEDARSLNMDIDEETKIIEGVFDGQNMIGPNGKNYPVPANYASKSKLIPGDVLKLTISGDGHFIYKQIGPIERNKIVGVLTKEDGQFKVLGEGKVFKVLLASVTYFKADVGDEVTLVVPAHEESEWGAIENVIPKVEGDDDHEEEYDDDDENN